jgi:hypothetical protein
MKTINLFLILSLVFTCAANASSTDGTDTGNSNNEEVANIGCAQDDNTDELSINCDEYIRGKQGKKSAASSGRNNGSKSHTRSW